MEVKEDQEDLVKVFSAANNAEADLVKAALEERDIPVYIRGYNHRSMLGVVGSYIDLDVMVPASMAEEAGRFLEEEWQSSQEIPAEEISREAQNSPQEEPQPLRPRSMMVAFVLPFFFPGLASFYVRNKSLGEWLCVGTAVCLISLFVLSPTQSPMLPFIGLGLVALFLVDEAASLIKVKRMKQEEGAFR
ncbi:MAG: DUF2007 domain-containing protein [bacterium]